MAELDRYLGHFGLNTTSRKALDKDFGIQEEVQDARDVARSGSAQAVDSSPAPASTSRVRSEQAVRYYLFGQLRSANHDTLLILRSSTADLSRKSASKHQVLRKIHIGIDAQTLDIRAIESTTNAIGDAPTLAELLAQIPEDELILGVGGDGAYDTDCVEKLGPRFLLAIFERARSAARNDDSSGGASLNQSYRKIGFKYSMESFSTQSYQRLSRRHCRARGRSGQAICLPIEGQERAGRAIASVYSLTCSAGTSP